MIPIDSDPQAWGQSYSYVGTKSLVEEKVMHWVVVIGLCHVFQIFYVASEGSCVWESDIRKLLSWFLSV